MIHATSFNPHPAFGLSLLKQVLKHAEDSSASAKADNMSR